MDEQKKTTEISDSQLFWYKNKNKVIAGIITVILLIVFGLVLMFLFSDKEEPEDETKFVNDETRIADYLITPTETKVILSEGVHDESKGFYDYNKVDEKDTNKNTIYANSNDLDSMYALDTETKKVVEYKVDNAKLGVSDVMTYKGDLKLESFKYSEDVLAGYSKGYITVQYKDKIEVIKTDKKVANYLVAKNRVLYAMGSKIYSYNVETKKTAEADLNKEIQDIELINNQVVAMSKFGATNKTSTIASFKIADLYATGLTTVPYTDTLALQNSDSNVDFYVFSKDNSKNAITTVTISNEILKVEKLAGTFDNVTEKDCGRNGYAYLIKEDKVSVIDVNSGNESGALVADKVLNVAPVFY